MAKRKPHRATKVPQHVKDAIKGGLREPQLAEIASYFFMCAGGTKAVSQLLWNEFSQAKPGSLMRQRILDLILKALRFANEKSGFRDDLGLASEEDLIRELEQLKNETRDGGEKHGEDESAASPG